MQVGEDGKLVKGLVQEFGTLSEEEDETGIEVSEDDAIDAPCLGRGIWSLCSVEVQYFTHPKVEKQITRSVRTTAQFRICDVK